MEILLQPAFTPRADSSSFAERRSESAQNKANRQSFNEDARAANVENTEATQEPEFIEAINNIDQSAGFRSNTSEAGARFYPEMKNHRAFAAIQTFENIRHFEPSEFIVDTFA